MTRRNVWQQPVLDFAVHSYVMSRDGECDERREGEERCPVATRREDGPGTLLFTFLESAFIRLLKPF